MLLNNIFKVQLLKNGTSADPFASNCFYPLQKNIHARRTPWAEISWQGSTQETTHHCQQWQQLYIIMAHSWGKQHESCHFYWCHLTNCPDSFPTEWPLSDMPWPGLSYQSFLYWNMKFMNYCHFVQSMYFSNLASCQHGHV